MAEYIEREALMDRLIKKTAEPGKIRYTEGFNDALMRFRSMLHFAPAADVVEVRHGKWIEDSSVDGISICSLCGHIDYRFSYTRNEWGSNYCSNCGAKMDKEKEK